MHVGHIISGFGHLIIASWLFLGNIFYSDKIEIDYIYAEIEAYSEQEYLAMLSRDNEPDVDSSVQTLELPEPSSDDVKPSPTKRDEQLETSAPDSPAVPSTNNETLVFPSPIYTDTTELTDETQQPEITEDPQVALSLPETTDTPAPIIADRVASVPIVPQNEDAFDDSILDSFDQFPSELDQKDLTKEEQNQTTRGATTEIITEPKKKPSGAPKKSLRPKGRPQIQTENEIKDTPSEDLVDAVSSALSNIENEQENSESIDTVSNTSLNSAATIESIGNALLKQIEPCWNVDVGNQNAYVKVTVAFSLDKNGKIERNEIKLVASEGGEGSAVRSAFTNAKKTIFKCQKKWDGFNLQDFDYEQWQQIVLTFNPDQMRNR